jgi:hypothetical protein
MKDQEEMEHNQRKIKDKGRGEKTRKKERKKEEEEKEQSTLDCHIQLSEQILGSLIPKPPPLGIKRPTLVVACISKHKSSQVKRSSDLL